MAPKSQEVVPFPLQLPSTSSSLRIGAGQLGGRVASVFIREEHGYVSHISIEGDAVLEVEGQDVEIGTLNVLGNLTFRQVNSRRPVSLRIRERLLVGGNLTGLTSLCSHVWYDDSFTANIAGDLLMEEDVITSLHGEPVWQAQSEITLPHLGVDGNLKVNAIRTLYGSLGCGGKVTAESVHCHTTLEAGELEGCRLLISGQGAAIRGRAEVGVAVLGASVHRLLPEWQQDVQYELQVGKVVGPKPQVEGGKLVIHPQQTQAA